MEGEHGLTKDDADSVEITPEMAEAGEEAFWRYQDLDTCTARAAAVAIFRAMAAVSTKRYSRSLSSSPRRS